MKIKSVILAISLSTLTSHSHASSSQDAAICKELTNYVMAGHLFAQAKQPFWKVMKMVEASDGSENLKATKLRMITVGYKAHQDNISEVDTYSTAYEGCKKGVESVEEKRNELSL